MAPAGITGDVIINGTYKTGLYGNTSLLLNNLDSGDYSAYSEHPEDGLYKQIDNSTTFKIIPQVDLEITKVVSNRTPDYKDEITWTLTVINHGTSVAENVIVEDTLPNGLVYLYDDSKDVIFVETGKQSKKTNNLKRNDKIYFCIDEGNPPYKGIRGKGDVKILNNPDTNLPIAERIMLKSCFSRQVVMICGNIHPELL